MAIKNANIIVVDDDLEVREMLEDFLQMQEASVVGFPSAIAALEEIESDRLQFPNGEPCNLVITDLAMPDLDGIDFAKRLKKRWPNTPVILMTAYGSIEAAIRATRIGIYSFEVKPFQLKEFEVRIAQALEHHQLLTENQNLKTQITSPWGRGGIIGKSKPMLVVFDLIERVAQSSANVLISGESGTGKELVAKAIHESSKRKSKPFVAVNCTAIPASLMESELFGHVKGSFTGATEDKQGLFVAAEGGTLFLDEIGDLEVGLQAKLLRVLQEREVKPVGSTRSRKIDVRILCATHKDLRRAISEGQFREDLYYRLSVIPVHIPPLRQRKHDINILAQHFLKKYVALNDTPPKSLSAGALQRLLAYSWPGNVRELENLIERVVVLSRGEVIDEADIPLYDDAGGANMMEQAISDWPTLHQLERWYIDRVLEKTGGQKEKASQILGISRRTLYRKEQEIYGKEQTEDQ